VKAIIKEVADPPRLLVVGVFLLLADHKAGDLELLYATQPQELGRQIPYLLNLPPHHDHQQAVGVCGLLKL